MYVQNEKQLKTFLIYKNGTKTCTIANLYSSKYHRRKKLETCQERPHMVSGCVLSGDHLFKTTTFEWSDEWSSYTGLTVFLVNSTHNIFTLAENAFNPFMTEAVII